MIHEFQIRGFRRFADYRLKDLRRVNLLVGDNNCGKTTILEALHVFVSEDEHTALRLAAFRRGEQIHYPSSDDRPGDLVAYASVKGFFHNRDISPGSSLSLSSGRRTCVLTVCEPDPRKGASVVGRFRDRLVETEWSNDEKPASDHQCSVRFGIDQDGAVDSVRLAPLGSSERSGGKCLFLSTDLSPHQIRTLWDSVNRQGRQSLVLEAIRIVAPEVERIHFSGLGLAVANPRVGIEYGTDEAGPLMPIGSLGAGVFRMLELGCSLVYCDQGTLLVDEIDAGLHWTRMADMWRMVIETAKANHAQVFATTHSADYIRGLDWACREHPELADEISLQTIDPELSESVPSNAEQLRTAIDQDIEVR